METSEIIKRICDEADKNREKIIDIGRYIYKNPEMGFCEEKASEAVRKVFDELGIKYTYPCALTGVKGRIGEKKHGINVCIIGEMDALKCSEHPDADSENRIHACGHNAQIAAMLGAAYGLKNIIKELDGNVIFMALPAEEFIDLEYRKKLKNDGRIEYMSGKQQLIAEGAFDDIDMAIMLHAQPDEPKSKLYMQGYNLGFSAGTITFRGKAAHGSTPYDGVNALNTAALAILGIHSNRETFKDEDRIRIHPIITKGGDVVNVVPDEVIMEMYVRGASFEAIEKGKNAVARSVKGACEMIGATAEIEYLPGYFPLMESRELSNVMECAAERIIGKENIVKGKEITGSTDMGNLSALIPVIQPSIGGFSGKLHSGEFKISVEETAYVTAAKILACTAAMLLTNGAEKAKKIKKQFEPMMTKEEYFKYINS